MVDPIPSVLDYLIFSHLQLKSENVEAFGPLYSAVEREMWAQFIDFLT